MRDQLIDEEQVVEEEVNKKARLKEERLRRRMEEFKRQQRKAFMPMHRIASEYVLSDQNRHSRLTPMSKEGAVDANRTIPRFNRISGMRELKLPTKTFTSAFHQGNLTSRGQFPSSNASEQIQLIKTGPSEFSGSLQDFKIPLTSLARAKEKDLLKNFGK